MTAPIIKPTKVYPLIIRGKDGSVILIITADGKIEVHDNACASDAARIFVESVQSELDRIDFLATGLRGLGKALKALSDDEMMDAAETFKKLLEANVGTVASRETVAKALSDFLDALDSGDD